MAHWLPTKIRPEGLNDTHLQLPLGKRDKEMKKTQKCKDKRQKIERQTVKKKKELIYN